MPDEKTLIEMIIKKFLKNRKPDAIVEVAREELDNLTLEGLKLIYNIKSFPLSTEEEKELLKKFPEIILMRLKRYFNSSKKKN